MENIFSLINEDRFIFEERDEIVLVFKEENVGKIDMDKGNIKDEFV